MQISHRAKILSVAPAVDMACPTHDGHSSGAELTEDTNENSEHGCILFVSRPSQIAMAADLKAELILLNDQQKIIEAQIAECSARLEAAGVGMHGPLVDPEVIVHERTILFVTPLTSVCPCTEMQGYPRSDLDVHSVRADRHQIIVLSNDHKIVLKTMEELLSRFHSQAKDQGNGATASVTTQLEVQSLNTATRPFAIIDEVASNSPADQAGLRVHDKIISIGSITAEPSISGAFSAVGGLIQERKDSVVDVEIVRDGVLLRLALTPRQWEGRGLLGCHLVPV